MILPPEAIPLLAELSPAFTEPTYRRFVTLLLAAVLTTGRRTVAHLLRTLGGLAKGAEARATSGRGHGREEERTSLQLPAPGGRPGKGQWKGLRSVGVVTSRCLRDGEEGIEARYDLSSPAVGIDLFARAVRGPWPVEGACHWALGVTFREDGSRVRERVLGAHITWRYRFPLSLLKQHPDRRMSLVMKRRGCGWSEKFLMEVINALVC